MHRLRKILHLTPEQGMVIIGQETEERTILYFVCLSVFLSLPPSPFFYLTVLSLFIDIRPPSLLLWKKNKTDESRKFSLHRVA